MKTIKYLFLLIAVAMTGVFADTLAPGYGQLDFTPPPAATYRLYSLGQAADGQVITQEGKEKSLHELFDDKLVVLNFVYLSCSDVNGCPLTTFVTQQIKRKIEKIPALKDKVRLLSLSFDYQRDTPEALAQHAKHLGADNQIWSLLTTQNEQVLEPILASYHQPIQKIVDKDGKETGEINHILRVFLIDSNKTIRNIYSTAFLHKDILINDIKTVLLEGKHSNISQH